MMEGSIQQELNICTLGVGLPNYVKEILTQIKGEVDGSK